MYRKAGVGPFDQRLLARWRGGLTGRTATHRIWRYGLIWFPGFLGLALGCIGYPTIDPVGRLWWYLGAALCVVLAIGVAYSRTKLVFRQATGLLTIHTRAVTGRTTQTMPVAQIGDIDVRSKDESTECIRFGPKSNRLTLYGSPGACLRCEAFLEEIRALPTLPP